MIWHVLGTNLLAGEIRGREALFRWFDHLHEITEGTFTLSEHDVLAAKASVSRTQPAVSNCRRRRRGIRSS